MTKPRFVSVLLLAMALWVVVVPTAHAGGSWLEPSSVRVEPGDTIALSGPVSRGQLGWIQDGPFYAYLSGPSSTVLTEVLGGGATDIPLGEIAMETIDANNMMPAVEVTIPPDVIPGEYWVTHCNDPCTTGFGDLIGAQLWVGMDPPVDVVETPTSTTGATTTLAPTTTATTTTVAALVVGAPPVFPPTESATPSGRDSGSIVPAVVVVLAVAIGGIVLAARRRRSAESSRATIIDANYKYVTLRAGSRAMGGWMYRTTGVQLSSHGDEDLERSGHGAEYCNSQTEEAIADQAVDPSATGRTGQDRRTPRRSQG